jgi:hypothetical protein
MSALLALAAALGLPQDPAGELQALLREYQAGPGGGAPTTDEERLRHIGRVYRHRDRVAVRLLDLAERHPGDPAAFDALVQAVWQVNTNPWPVSLVGAEAGHLRSFELLRRDHLRDGRLGPLCERISAGFRREYEAVLRAVLEVSPHREVRATACLALARYLGGRLRRLELLGERPDLAREFEELFGKDYLAELRAGDREAAEREVEALLERVGKDFGDVRGPAGGLLAEQAGAELFERRHLGAGREAPDIEGTDQDGRRFRLRDYRGKVVLLDFWSRV